MQQEKNSTIPWPILASAFLLAFAMGTPQFCVPPMEHILKEELLLTHAQTSLLFTAPFIMLVALAIPGGIVADRLGIRKAAGIGAIIMAVGAVLRGIAADPSTLLALTFVYGAGFGLVFPNLPKLVSLWVPPGRAGVATGIYIAAVAIGTAVPIAVTLPLIFPITSTIQGTFFIWGIPVIIAAILWWILVREPPSESVQAQHVSGGDKPSYQVWKNKSLWLIAILFVMQTFFSFTWTGWAPALMMEKGAPPDLAALIASLTPWVAIPSVLLAPRLSDKLGLRKPFIWLPSIIMAFASLWAIYATVPMGWGLMTLVGILSSTRFVIIMTLPVEIMPREAVGAASGLVLSVGHVGAMLGPLVGGHILDLTGSLNLSLLVLIGISIAMIGIAFKIPETGPRARAQE